jgi:DNA-binding beta-propeller fold protein YncE
MRSHLIQAERLSPSKLLTAVCALAWVLAASAAERGPLVLEAKIPLGEVKGRIDHLAIDVARRRLFVAELGNDTVGVVDIDARKVVRSLRGFDEPQGVAYFSQIDTLYVANGGDGVLSAFRGAQLEPAGRLDLGDDADNIRIDRDQGRVYVGTGSGNLTVIDTAAFKKTDEIELKAHPESFQLESKGSRIYVNVPDAHEVAVVDRKTNKQTASWPTAGLKSNYPMALDSSPDRVLVVFRQPATLVSFDAGSGAVKERMDLCGDADDVFVDARRSYIYVTCGQGAIDVVARHDDRMTRVARTETSPGARTALFSPELDRLFVAARAAGAEGAAVWVFRPVDGL